MTFIGSSSRAVVAVPIGVRAASEQEAEHDADYLALFLVLGLRLADELRLGRAPAALRPSAPASSSTTAFGAVQTQTVAPASSSTARLRAA